MPRCDPLECICNELKPLVLETVELFAGKEFQSWVATLFKSWLPLIHFIHIPQLPGPAYLPLMTSNSMPCICLVTLEH